MPTPGINITDTLAPMRGEFRLIGRDKENNIVFCYEDLNMIVNDAKAALAQLISNTAAQSKVIKFIGFGTGTTIPNPNNTTLTDFYKKDILAFSYPEPGRVKFTWRLGYGEANGKDISEFGLMCQDNSLFARKVRGAIKKEEDLALEGEWTIIF